MKKLHLVFGFVALGVVLIGLIHGGVAWMIAEVTWDPMETSFPAWAAFVVPMLFYGMGAFAVLLAWLFTSLIVRRVRKKPVAKDR